MRDSQLAELPAAGDTTSDNNVDCTYLVTAIFKQSTSTHHQTQHNNAVRAGGDWQLRRARTSVRELLAQSPLCAAQAQRVGPHASARAVPPVPAAGRGEGGGQEFTNREEGLQVGQPRELTSASGLHGLQ